MNLKQKKALKKVEKISKKALKAEIIKEQNKVEKQAEPQAKIISF